MIDHDFRIAIGLYIANCVAQSMPSPSGKSELYTFIYRLVHLLLFNIKNVVSSVPQKIAAMAEISEPGGATATVAIAATGKT